MSYYDFGFSPMQYLPATAYSSIVVSNHRSWSVLRSNYRFDVQNGLWENLASVGAQEIRMQGLLDGYAAALTEVLIAFCAFTFGLGLLLGKLIWGQL